MLNKKYWVILVIISVIAIFPRAAEVFNPYNYFFDPEQGTEYLVTKSIVVDHQAVLTAHQGGFGSFSKGPAFNYLLVIPFILAEGNPFGGRLMMLVISVLTVPLAFVFANRMLGLRTASLISFLLAVSPSLKDYAGAISPPFVIPLLTVFFIYFLYKSLQGEFKNIPLLIFTVGLMTHFEMAAAGILLTLLMLTGFVCVVKKTIPYRYYFLSAGLFLLSILPLVVFDILNNFQNIRGVIRMISAGKENALAQMGTSIGNIFGTRLNVFGWSFISTFSPNLFVWVSLLILLLLGLLLIVRNKNIKHNQKVFISYLTFVPFFTFIVLMIYPGNVVNQWWIMDLTVIYCFLLGFVLDYFWKMNKLRVLVFMVVFILSIAFIKRTLFIYKTQFAYPPTTYIKEDQAIKYIFENSKGKPFGIVVLSARTQENYDYLIWWNGRKYGYQPDRTPKKIYYVIIEPHLIYPLSKTPGNLIETKQLTNGFTIEQRLVN